MRNVAFVAAVILVIVLGIGALYLYRAQTPATTVLASPTPTAIATVTATPARSPTPSAPPTGLYVNSTYKFSVVLPPPYRKSSRLSVENTNTQNPSASLALDAFTARSEQDEAALAGQSCEVGCALRNYVAIVEIYNAQAQTPRQWYASHGGAAGERIDDTTVDGRMAIRVTNGVPVYMPVQLIVLDGARIFRIGYEVYPSQPIPGGASKEKLDAIITSFKFVP